MSMASNPARTEVLKTSLILYFNEIPTDVYP